MMTLLGKYSSNWVNRGKLLIIKKGEQQMTPTEAVEKSQGTSAIDYTQVVQSQKFQVVT